MHPFPERERPEPCELHLFIRHPELDLTHTFMYQVDVVDGHLVHFTVHRMDLCRMVLRQHERRADGPEDAVVDRCDLGQLQRLDRRMYDRAAEGFIVRGRTRRGRYADTVPAEAFEMLVAYVDVADERRAVLGAERRFVQRKVPRFRPEVLV